MKIIWSDLAKKSYEKIIDDILERWAPSIAIDFENLTNNLLNSLILHKNLCPQSKKQKLRRCVIHKNISLIYRVKNGNIELIIFIDNRANHNF